MELYYCEACTKRITASQQQSGGCRNIGQAQWCPNCVANGTASKGGTPFPQDASAQAVPQQVDLASNVITIADPNEAQQAGRPSKGRISAARARPQSSQRIPPGRRRSSRREPEDPGLERSQQFYKFGAIGFALGCLFWLLAFLSTS